MWFSADDLGTKAVISGVVGSLLALAAGWLGGKVGDRYHRRADSLVTSTRDGGIGAEPAASQEVVEGRARADLASSGRQAGTAGRRGR